MDEKEEEHVKLLKEFFFDHIRIRLISVCYHLDPISFYPQHIGTHARTQKDDFCNEKSLKKTIGQTS